jgi:hypothetical protein
MLIITTSPSISAVRTEGLRETIVESAMRLVASALSEVPPVCIAFCCLNCRDHSLFRPAHEVENAKILRKNTAKASWS